MAEPKARIERAFKAVMSRGDDVPLDPEEVALVEKGVEEGVPIRLKQGIINPSFLVSIVEDKERRRFWLDDAKYDDRKREQGMKALPDILATSTLKLGPGK